MKQQTLQNAIRVSGKVLLAGHNIQVRLNPAPADSGIVFRRMDLAQPVTMPAVVASLADSWNGSLSLVSGDVRIDTVEHLLSALAGLGIDNVLIEVDGPEIPIMDGSVAPFIFLIQAAGIKRQDASKKFIRIKRPVEVREGDDWVRFDPAGGFQINLQTDAVGQASMNFSTTAFVKEYSRTRSPLLSGQNGHWRCDNESAKHGVVDAIGELYLLGRNLIGNLSGHNSGHMLRQRLLRTLLADRSAWEEVSFDEKNAPAFYAQPA